MRPSHMAYGTYVKPCITHPASSNHDSLLTAPLLPPVLCSGGILLTHPRTYLRNCEGVSNVCPRKPLRRIEPRNVVRARFFWSHVCSQMYVPQNAPACKRGCRTPQGKQAIRHSGTHGRLGVVRATDSPKQVPRVPRVASYHYPVRPSASSRVPSGRKIINHQSRLIKS